MSHVFYRICPSCGFTFPIKDEYFGVVFACPSCSTPLVIKEGTTSIINLAYPKYIDPKEIV